MSEQYNILKNNYDELNNNYIKLNQELDNIKKIMNY
jgi:hypothetical protein